MSAGWRAFVLPASFSAAPVILGASGWKWKGEAAPGSFFLFG